MATSTPLPTFDLAVEPSLSALNVTMKEYLITHGQYESAIATGAFVFDDQDRLLLVQRAAHDSLPNLWETPGGAVDNDDPTILHGVARELWEESGLKLTSVKQQIGVGHIFFTHHGLRIVKFSFVVEVESTEKVTLSDEHQNYVWASEEECRNHRVLGESEDGGLEIKFTFQAHEKTVLEGFRLWKESKKVPQIREV